MTEKETTQELRKLVGQNVRVAITRDGYSRNHYDAQIAIQGTLEAHTEAEAYRVIVNNDIFAYFEPSDVVLVNLMASYPTIMLTIPVKETATV
jgi:glutamine synthetase type III